MPQKNQYKPVPEGTKFWKLTVGKFTGFDHKRRALFECTCDCGTVKIIPASSMRNGSVKSCGCLPAERMRGLSSSLAEDLTGKRFGKLMVLKRLEIRAISGSFLYECQCDCGALTKVNTHHLTGGLRTTCKAWHCRDDFQKILKEMDQPSPNALKDAYLAGHFDGEGCITFQGESYFPHLTVSVSICYKPTLLEYQEAFGGNIKRVDPRRRDKRWTRIQWRWGIGAQHEVLKFVCRLIPYSSEKRAQLELAKDYLLRRSKFEKYNTSEEFIQQIPIIKTQMSALKRFEYAN